MLPCDFLMEVMKEMDGEAYDIATLLSNPLLGRPQHKQQPQPPCWHRLFFNLGSLYFFVEAI